MDHGTSHGVRHFRHRLRCLRKGHRWQAYERLDGDTVVATERCVRCGAWHHHEARPLEP
jgi:hypothetical protein